MSKKLYRNKQIAMLGGVCAGLADYFEIDTVIVRLIFMFLLIFGGGGLIMYIIMWIVVPANNQINNSQQNYYNYQSSHEGDNNCDYTEDENINQTNTSSATNTESVTGGNMNKKLDSRQIIGIALIIFGALFILDKFIPIQFQEYFFPAIMILIGVLLVFNK